MTFGHLFVNDLSSAIAVRAAHGMVGAALSSLGLYYMIQAFPAKWRLKALVLPLARLFSEDLLQIAEWRGLYLFELGLALAALGCVFLLKLPPWRPLQDLRKTRFSYLCSARHRSGIAVRGTVPRPYRLVVGCTLDLILIRLVFSEQSTGAVGFLQALNMGSEQMRSLYLVMLVGSIAGLAVSALTIHPEHLLMPLIISLALMALGSSMDSFSNNLTRPANMYLSQFLLAFGGTFFVGPTMAALGARNVLSNPRNLVSFSVLFGICNNLGGLIGSALLGTFQVVRGGARENPFQQHRRAPYPD